MYELFSTITLAFFAWARPVYKLIVKKEEIEITDTLLAPIMYFAFILGSINFSELNSISILVFYFLIMHVIVFVVIFTFTNMRQGDENQ